MFTRKRSPIVGSCHLTEVIQKGPVFWGLSEIFERTDVVKPGDIFIKPFSSLGPYLEVYHP
jgi:hypothetical protein